MFKSVRAIFSNQAINAAIQFAGVPIFLALWGVDLYGEWLLLSVFVTGIAMSDVGVASATANEMTVYVGAEQFEKANQSYRNGWSLLTILSLVFSALVFSLLLFTPLVDWIGLQTSSHKSVQWTTSLLIIQTLLAMQSAMVYASIRSEGKLAVCINLASVQRVVEFTFQIIAVYFYRTLEAAAAAGLLARIIEYLLAVVVQRQAVPWLKMRWNNLSLTFDRQIFRPAMASMAFPVGHIFGNQAILALIGNQLGASGVTIFATHRTLANVALQIVQGISHAVLPEFSLAFGSGNTDLVKRLHRRSCQISFWLGMLACVGIGLFAKPFLEFWTGGKVAFEPMLMTALLVWVAARSLWYTSLFVSMSINLHHRIALVYVAGTLCSLLIAVPMTQSYGLAGTAFALLATDVAMSYYVLKSSFSLVGDTAASFWGFVIGYGR